MLTCKVALGNSMPSMAQLSCCIPQGSVLVPFYLLYTCCLLARLFKFMMCFIIFMLTTLCYMLLKPIDPSSLENLTTYLSDIKC